MPVYAYIAKDIHGEVVRATVKADSRHAALGRLRSRELTPISLEEVGGGSGKDRPKAVRRALFQPRISLSDRAILCRQLATSVNAGVSLRESIESIAVDQDHPGLKRVLGDIVEQLHVGLTFSEALARHPDVFDLQFVALIRAAEESGSLPQTLEQLADTLERNQRLANRVRSITAYPIFVAVFFVIVGIIMTLVILPRFQKIFSGMHARLPLMTRIVFGANQFVVDNILYLVVVVVTLIVAAVLFGRTYGGQLFYDRLKLKLPLFGPCILKFTVAKFCQNLAIMLRGGVPVAMAMELSADTCGNRVMQKALLQARDRVIGGSGIANSLEEDKRFPRLVVRMVNVGESSGRLPEVLDRVAQVYEDQVESAIMVATSLFEPIVICFFGIIVLVTVLAIYMPIFSAAGHSGR